MGPSVATQILLNSSLSEKVDLRHFDTRINDDIDSLGRFKWRKLGKVSRQWRDFQDVLQEFKPDIVHIPIGQTTMGFWKDAPYIYRAKEAGARVLIHLRGSVFREWYSASHLANQRAVDKLMARVDGAIVLGQNLTHIFEPWLSPEKIHVVPNGGDYDFPSNHNQKQKIEILYLSNFLPGKGFDVLLEALGDLRGHGETNWHLTARGRRPVGSFIDRCSDIIEQRQLGDSIDWGDVVQGDEKWKLLSQADIFVFPPVDPEGQPWALIEAIAAGLPCISTDRGAISETVIHGYSGFITPPGHREGLEAALQMLITQEDLRISMSQRARQHYLTHFTTQHMVDRLLNVYQKLRSCAV